MPRGVPRNKTAPESNTEISEPEILTEDLGDGLDKSLDSNLKTEDDTSLEFRLNPLTQEFETSITVGTSYHDGVKSVVFPALTAVQPSDYFHLRDQGAFLVGEFIKDLNVFSSKFIRGHVERTEEDYNELCLFAGLIIERNNAK